MDSLPDMFGLSHNYINDINIENSKHIESFITPLVTWKLLVMGVVKSKAGCQSSLYNEDKPIELAFHLQCTLTLHPNWISCGSKATVISITLATKCNYVCLSYATCVMT